MRSVKSKLLGLLLFSIVLALLLAGVLLSLGVRHFHENSNRSQLAVVHATLRADLERLNQKSEQIAHGLATDPAVVSSLNMLSGYASQGPYQAQVFDPEKRRLARDADRRLAGASDIGVAVFDNAGTLVAFASNMGNGVHEEGFVSYEAGQPLYLLAEGSKVQVGALPENIQGMLDAQGYEERFFRMRVSAAGLHLEYGVPVVRIGRGDILRSVGFVVVSQVLGEAFINAMDRYPGIGFGLLTGDGVVFGDAGGVIEPAAIPGLPSMLSSDAGLDAGWYETAEHYARVFELPLSNGKSAYFVLSTDKEVVAFQIRQTLYVILGVLLLSALIVLPLGVRIAERWISRPVRRLLAGVGDIREGRYESLREMPDMQGEFGQLSNALREMAVGIDEREGRLRIWNRVIAESREAIIVTDPDENILAVNPAFTQITGYSAEEAIGKTPRLFHSGQHDRDFYMNMWHSLDSTGHWQGEVWDRARNGRIFPKWLAVTAVRDESGKVANYIAIFSDVSEHKATLAQIQFLAHHDALTLLPNRALLQDRLALALAGAEREKNRLAVLFMDLDRFKNINDSLGHNVGDALLKTLAERLKSCVREVDTVSRFGGDEFVLVLGRLRQPDDATLVAETILARVAEPIMVEGHELLVTPSIGISIGPDDGSDPAVLIKNADAAMYHAKERGRNNFQFYSADMNERAERRLTLEGSLRRALERGEFRLFYQPKVEVRSGRFVGVEALIRWQKADGGFVSPLDFIPLAEDTGLILPIGDWVLREACQQLQRWREAGLPLVPIAVNISAVQFQHLRFAADTRRVVREYAVPPGGIELELTESIVMRDPEQVARVLQDLKDDGFTLAIDDFGTGYSSLSYLKRFPLDKLKIDASFVRDIARDPTDRAIARSVVALGASLGLAVVAEGVEGEAELRLLHEMGCHQAQGYYFCRPLAAADFAAWLAGYVASPLADGEAG